MSSQSRLVKDKGNEQAISLCFELGKVTNLNEWKPYGRLLPLQKTIDNTKTIVKVERTSRQAKKHGTEVIGVVT